MNGECKAQVASKTGDITTEIDCLHNNVCRLEDQFSRAFGLFGSAIVSEPYDSSPDIKQDRCSSPLAHTIRGINEKLNVLGDALVRMNNSCDL